MTQAVLSLLLDTDGFNIENASFLLLKYAFLDKKPPYKVDGIFPKTITDETYLQVVEWPYNHELPRIFAAVANADENLMKEIAINVRENVKVLSQVTDVEEITEFLKDINSAIKIVALATVCILHTILLMKRDYPPILGKTLKAFLINTLNCKGPTEAIRELSIVFALRLLKGEEDAKH